MSTQATSVDMSQRMIASLLAISGIAALLYPLYTSIDFGIDFGFGAPGLNRAMIKMLAVFTLALAVLWHGRSPAHLMLCLGLGFGALGDMFLALPGDHFTHGVGSFLIGHLFYIAFFWRDRKRMIKPWRMALVAVVTLATALGLVLVLPGSDGMAIPLVIYAFVLSAMVISCLVSTVALPLMMPGALLFWLSDGVLLIELFLAPNLMSAAHWTWANWLLYYPAQLLLFLGGIGALAAARKMPYPVGA